MIAHSRTKDLGRCLRQAGRHTLVAAVGRPQVDGQGRLCLAMVITDVGINCIDAPERGEGKSRKFESAMSFCRMRRGLPSSHTLFLAVSV